MQFCVWGIITPGVDSTSPGGGSPGCLPSLTSSPGQQVCETLTAALLPGLTHFAVYVWWGVSAFLLPFSFHRFIQALILGLLSEGTRGIHYGQEPALSCEVLGLAEQTDRQTQVRYSPRGCSVSQGRCSGGDGGGGPQRDSPLPSAPHSCLHLSMRQHTGSHVGAI